MFQGDCGGYGRQPVAHPTRLAKLERQRFQWLDQALTQLSDLCRQIILLKKQGLSAKVIGSQLEKTENAINQRFSNCMQRWKKEYDQLRTP